jgi:tyrosyl-tRNA synthetase
LGIDPTSTKLHLGRTVALRKLNEFAKLGHNVTFLIGDFTALVGDTSDKDSERPILTPEEIEENFKTYKKQAEKILDFSKIKVRKNSEWLSKLTYADVFKLKQQFSLNDFISRELIKKRLGEGKKIRLDETEYPIMQGYDSHFMDTDLQIGGTDQTFNMQAGRTLQKRLRNKESYILATEFLMGTDGRKMSKRWGNVISPSVVSDEYGSDALRVYEMFLGPLEQSKAWDPKAITGSRRFIDRVWQIQQKVQQEQSSQEEADRTNLLVENVTNYIESGKFNLVVSEFMKYLNFIDKSGKIGKQSYETFLKTLAPYTPFITEELWERVGNKYSIHQSSWPEAIKREQSVNQVPIPITVNGKLIGTILLPEGLGDTEEEILDFVRNNEKFAHRLENLTVKKIVYKRGKIFNIAT